MQLAKRLEQFPEYIFASLKKKKVEIEQKTGKKVIDFGIGSPDFPPSEKFLEVLKDAYDDDGVHMYPGFGPTKELTEAIQKFYQKRFGVELNDKEVVQANGGKYIVSHLPMALIDPDDEVLVPDPGYAAYQTNILMAGGKAVPYNLTKKNDFKIDFDELTSKVSSKTRFIWVNFPGNPTGQIAELADLQKIVEFCKQQQIWLVYDNAYADITFGDFKAPSILQVAGAKEVAVELNSLSKSHSFAGFRIGYLAGNEQIIQGFAKLQSQYDSGMSLPLQKVAAYALNNPDSKWHTEMLSSYQERMDIIAEKFETLGLEVHKPQASLYLWIEIPEEFKDSTEYCYYLLEKKNILVAPGLAFGENGRRYIRVSICVNIDSIEDYFNS